MSYEFTGTARIRCNTCPNQTPVLDTYTNQPHPPSVTSVIFAEANKWGWTRSFDGFSGTDVCPTCTAEGKGGQGGGGAEAADGSTLMVVEWEGTSPDGHADQLNESESGN